MDIVILRLALKMPSSIFTCTKDECKRQMRLWYMPTGPKNHVFFSFFSLCTLLVCEMCCCFSLLLVYCFDCDRLFHSHFKFRVPSNSQRIATLLCSYGVHTHGHTHTTKLPFHLYNRQLALIYSAARSVCCRHSTRMVCAYIHK